MEKKYFLSHPRRPNKNEYDYQEISRNLREAHLIAENELSEFNLVQPFVEIPQDDSISDQEAMIRCINLLLECDGIIMTGDWRKSQNCKVEFAVAHATGKTILELIE